VPSYTHLSSLFLRIQITIFHFAFNKDEIARRLKEIHLFPQKQSMLLPQRFYLLLKEKPNIISLGSYISPKAQSGWLKPALYWSF
jgi:hypothetical protein